MISNETLLLVPFFALSAVAVAAWFVAAYSMIGVLTNTTGSRLGLLFRPAWWTAQNAGRYLAPPGIAHSQRLMRAIIWFLGAIILAIAYGLGVVLWRN